MSSNRTRQAVPERSTGKHREKTSQVVPGDLQQELDLIDPEAAKNHTADGYEVLRDAVEMFGGQKKLALHLGKGLAYNSKISDGLTRADDRRAQFDWLIPLLQHEQAGLRVLNWMCAVAGCKPPEPLVQLTAIDKLRIVSGELSEPRLRKLEREHGLPSGSLDP